MGHERGGDAKRTMHETNVIKMVFLIFVYTLLFKVVTIAFSRF